VRGRRRLDRWKRVRSAWPNRTRNVFHVLTAARGGGGGDRPWSCAEQRRPRILTAEVRDVGAHPCKRSNIEPTAHAPCAATCSVQRKACSDLRASTSCFDLARL